MLTSIDCLFRIMLAALGVFLLGGSPARASDFSEPWKRADRALVIDAYEYNPIDWQKLVSDKRIAGFINKGSDGLPPPYKCSGNETETRLCSALWKRHAVARELFHTRRTVAKALGLKWGAYHLGRPGNPIEQANNFIDFTEPAPDDLIALDIEDIDARKWISLEDAEIFARHIYTRLKRWPVLYTNGNTALHIAQNRDRYTILSRLPLWYARYKPTIGLHFPKGHWASYALWQFAARPNCDARSCPYRAPGTPLDIDVNVASMSVKELREKWPFSELVERQDYPDPETVPIPVARRDALKGEDVSVEFVDVSGDAESSPKEVQAAAGMRDAFDDAETITVETDERIPLPVWRSEARKKHANVTLTFVPVEKVVLKEAVAYASANSSPFQALLGKRVVPTTPVVLAGYAETGAPRPAVRRSTQAQPSPHYSPSGEVSTAALDQPGPILSATPFSRRELPVFLLRRLDGLDEGF